VHHLRRATDLLLDYRFQPIHYDLLAKSNKFKCEMDKSELTLDWDNDSELLSFSAGLVCKERQHIIPVPCPNDANVTNFKKYENEDYILIRLPYESENLTQ
jgi:hypothetical protein